MTTTEPHEGNLKRSERRPAGWLAWAGLRLALLALVFLATREGTICRERMPTLIDGRPPTGVDCDGPIVGTWMLTDVEVDGQSLDLSVLEPSDWGFPVGQITSRSDGTYVARVCNSFGGAYHFSYDEIRRGEGGSTAIGCQGLHGEIERAVHRGLTGRYEIVTDSLIFRSSQVTLLPVRIDA